jgi:hypothetical protein
MSSLSQEKNNKLKIETNILKDKLTKLLLREFVLLYSTIALELVLLEIVHTQLNMI